MIRHTHDELVSMTSTLCNSAHTSVSVATALFTALQAKHAPTAYHCLRVAQNVTAWGLYHGIERELLGQLEVLGLLHDVGKIGIPERILQKPDRLSEQERSIIVMHPSVGTQILRAAGLEDCIIQSVARLGEWFDGTYAQNKSSPLPMHARVLAIADAFDAMITEQRYRPAMKLEEALDELIRKSGTQFDPTIVPTFVQAALACDTALQLDVEERWKHFGFEDHVADLFKAGQGIHSSSTAENSLNAIFHRRLSDHMNDGVIFIDTENRILEWNRTAETMSGCSRTSLYQQRWTPELIKLQDDTGKSITEATCPLLSVVRDGGERHLRLSMQHRDGSRRAVQVQVIPIHDDRGVCRGAAMIFDDITRQKNLEQAVEKLHQRASIDPLTKVNNRAELNLHLPMISRDVADGRCIASVIICDIDYFKRINDTYGHAAGDEALVAFAAILKDGARETDLVARYGGEEFVILCRDCSIEDAAYKAETIRRALASKPLSAIRGKCLSASFGVAEITAQCPGEKALNAADSALLRAKQNGRNRVERADQELLPQVEETNSKTTPKPTSWLSWLGMSSSRLTQQADILVTVPPELVIEKLRGFLDEWDATVGKSEDGNLMVTIDLRKAPEYQRTSDRDISFQLQIQIQLADYLPENQLVAAKARTLVSVTIASTSRRERRTGTVEEIMQRIIKNLNRYLVGEVLDAEQRKRVHIHTRR